MAISRLHSKKTNGVLRDWYLTREVTLGKVPAIAPTNGQTTVPESLYKIMKTSIKFKKMQSDDVKERSSAQSSGVCLLINSRDTVLSLPDGLGLGFLEHDSETGLYRYIDAS